MTQDLWIAIVAMIGGVAGAVATIITAWRKVSETNLETLARRQQRSDERIAQLEEHGVRQDLHIAAQDRQIASLDAWKIAARYYIAILRGILADMGIQSPEPPPELQLTGDE